MNECECPSRDVHDVLHKVTSVGSRSVEKAQEFIDRIAGGDKSIKAFGTYEEVYTDEVNFHLGHFNVYLTVCIRMLTQFTSVSTLNGPTWKSRS